MEVVVILGPLGSGKTTLVNRILQVSQNLRTLVVVNDVGTENIDARRLKNAGDIKALTAGCIGCSGLPAFRRVIKEAKEMQGLDLVIIEPTGIADGREIRDAVVSAGCKFHALTLIDVQHFERNRALECMQSQLEVATAVGLTWVGSDALPEKVMEYIGKHGPGKPVVKIDTEELLEMAIQTVLSEETTMSHTHVCKSGCGHDHHHHHDHGVYSFSLQLREETLYVDLVLALAPHLESLVRAKGVVAGREFDFVQGDISLGDSITDHPHGNFIFNRKVENKVLFGISKVQKEDNRTKKDRMRNSDVALEATLAAITWQLGQYPSVVTPTGLLRVDCEADVVYQMAKRKGVPMEVKQIVMAKYLSWRVEGMKEIQLNSWENHPDLPYWKRRLGINLSYMPAVYPELVNLEILQQIVAVNSVQLLVEGLLDLTELSFDEEMAEEKPETVKRCLLWGVETGQITKEVAERAIAQCAFLAKSNREWLVRWK